MSKLNQLLAANFLNNFGWSLYAPLYGLFVLYIGGTATDVSLVFSAYALIAGLLIISFGRLENTRAFNANIMLVVGYSLFIAVAIGYIFVNSVGTFYLMQMVLAVAMGILTPAAKATYAKAEHAGKEAGEWGIFDGGNYLIGSLAAFCGGLLLAAGNFRLVFIVMAFIQIGATVFALMHYRLTAKNR